MSEHEPPRTIHVLAAGDAMIRALAEHLPTRRGWRVAPLDGMPEPEALVIVDLDDAAAEDAVDALRTDGFAGPVLIVGHAGDARWPDDEPLPRPVRLGVLLARINTHWARIAAAGAVALGPYAFIPGERLLHHGDGDVIRLTELENRLLLHLAEAGGALVDREQLLAHVWGYSAGVDSHTVETHVWRLRQKIETDDPATRFLVTEAGGYRLLAGGGQEG